MTHPTPAASGELVPTFHGILDGVEQPLVDARTLHAFLGVGRDFSSWLKVRILDYEFVEGKDFAIFPHSGGNTENKDISSAGRPTANYSLSLDMAKELAMVERSERGRQVRRYFIALEKRVLAQKDTSRLLWLIDELQDAYCQAHPEALKLLRYRRLGLSQKEIGRLLGVSRQTVSARLKRLAALGFGDDPQLALPGIATREV